jgi:hypothetical protein
MSSLLQPLHLLLMMFAGWVNRHQLEVIAYLQEENRMIKELSSAIIRCSSHSVNLEPRGEPWHD